MNQAATGGGGGGGAGIVYDHETVAGVSRALTTAASDMDGLGRTVPDAGSTGLAQPILSAMLAGVAQASARLAVEADTIGALVSQCNRTAYDQDQASAESLLVERARNE